jgi:hypothetical protein
VIDKEKRDSYNAWSEATKNFISEIGEIAAGRKTNDKTLMRQKAETLKKLFDEYRKAWGIE